MNYVQALNQLYGLASLGIQMGLERVEAAAVQLGSPHRKLNCIQVAGTNGKGTVSTLVADALLRGGVKVGLFTSPHLHRFAERIKINGVEADPQTIANALESVFALTEQDPNFKPTFFETATLAALIIFADEEVEWAVLEVGLGGRLDSTSVVTPQITAITSIGLDHTTILGDTLEAIAGEKAAIARPGTPLIVGPLPSPALEVVQEVASAVKAELRVCGLDFPVPQFIDPPWPGQHSRENAAVAFEILKQQGSLPPGNLQSLFEKTLTNVVWPGRFETIEFKGRRILFDGAHNTEAILALKDGMNERHIQPQLTLFGSVSDKPVEPMLQALRDQGGRILLAPPPLPRAFEPQRYASGDDLCASSTQEAIERIEELTHVGDTILVTGSLFTVGEARRIVLAIEADPPIRM